MSTAVADIQKAVGTEAEQAVALALPPALRLGISPDDFWTLCAANRDLRLERTAEGVLIAMMPAATETGMRNAVLTFRVGFWANEDMTGTTFDSSAGFTLPNSAVRSPDVSWIHNDHWNALTRDQQERFAPLCPDFVAELCSPFDDKATLQSKMAEYIVNGARLGWLIDYVEANVEIYRPGRDVEVLANPKTLSGEDVLPGLVLDLKDIL
jgi:Uma2 family endonuclease